MATMYMYICRWCSAEFQTKESPGSKRPPKYCSHKCYARSKSGKSFYSVRGHIPWNKKSWIEKTCGICGQSFTVTPAREKIAKYCSCECTHEAKRRTFGPSHPLWTRTQMPCEFCGKMMWVKTAKADEFRFCSRRCHGAYIAQKMAMLKGPTSIEKMLMDELDKREISYRAQHPISHWLIDITLPQHRIAIEADGDYWHNSKEQQTKDANKDRWLRAHKWTIFRFSGTEIRKSPAACIDKIVSSLHNG